MSRIKLFAVPLLLALAGAAANGAPTASAAHGHAAPAYRPPTRKEEKLKQVSEEIKTEEKAVKAREKEIAAEEIEVSKAKKAEEKLLGEIVKQSEHGELSAEERKQDDTLLKNAATAVHEAEKILGKSERTKAKEEARIKKLEEKWGIGTEE